MPVTININNLSLCHKASGGMSIATIPDVCKTPSPGGPVPIPYPNIAMESDLEKGTKTIKADGGNMCANYGSEFSKSTGDEAGTVGGILSSTFIKEATWITYSFDVKLEGKGACRLTDKMFHNHQNTVDIAGATHSPVAAKPMDCKSLAESVKEGDVVLRSTAATESDLIRKLGGCDYSHAGIVTKDPTDPSKFMVTDAYPRGGSDVGTESVEDFFCSKKHSDPPGTAPDKGLVARPKDPAVAKKAAEWAQQQTKDPAYKFNIFNDFRSDPKDVYCSDFVHQAFQNGGVDVVPNPMDFMSSTNKANTVDALREFVKKGGYGRPAQMAEPLTSNSMLERKIKGKFTNFEYITPCQVANNSHMTKVASFP